MGNLVLPISMRVIAVHYCATIILIGLRVIWLLWSVVILVFTGVWLGWDHGFVLRDCQLKLEVHPQLVRWNDFTFILDSRVEVTIFGEITEDLTLWIGGSVHCQTFFIRIKENTHPDHSSIQAVVNYRSNQLWVAEPPVYNSDNHDACRVWEGLIRANWKLIHWWLWEGLICI